MDPAELRWLNATPEMRAKAIALADETRLIRLMAEDLLEGTGEKLSTEAEAGLLGVSKSTVRRRKKPPEKRQ